jgi:hypothetical protein
MKKLALLAVWLALPWALLAQAPTNAPQFQVTLNFLGGQPYGQASALSTAFTTQFTTNTALRADVLAMPGAGYTGYLGGAQYNLCGISALEKLLAPTSISCGKIEPYLNGAAGLGRIQLNGTSTQSVAALARFGLNYDTTGQGKFTINLFEGGYGKFGPSVIGQPNQGWFFQSGISVGMGTSAAATQAKAARMNRANAKKLKLMNAAIQKANKG